MDNPQEVPDLIETKPPFWVEPQRFAFMEELKDEKPNENPNSRICPKVATY